jgi:CubicO group peptidase (beta-lactamase class C family)
MKIPWYSLTAIHTLAASALFAAEAPKPLAENTDVAAALGVFDAWADWTAKHRDQPAVSIGIVYDQDLIWAKGYGYADLAKKTPATPATAYRIASISKTFTAHALLQLRDAGKLQLDDPVTKWIPELKLAKIDPANPVITISHLLTHTAGIPREVDGTYWNDMKFPTREAMLEVLARMGVVWEPDKDFKYSNVALSLAGYIVEAASGEPYAEYMERHVLTPLGMSGTRVLPTTDMPALAVGYGRFVPATPRRIEPFFNGAYMIPASNFASSVEDLARYVALQFRRGPAGGAQILKGSTLAEMQRVHWVQPDWKSGWGLGWAVNRVNDQTRVYHTGSVPGHRTSVSFVPADKFGVIVLTNSEDGRPSIYTNQAYAIVAPAIAKATAKPPADPKIDPMWQKYVGVYTWEDDEMHVAVIGGKLCMFDPSYDNPWDSKIALEPVSGNVFRQMDGDDKGETVTFILDDSGNVTRYEAPGYYMERRR